MPIPQWSGSAAYPPQTTEQVFFDSLIVGTQAQNILAPYPDQTYGVVRYWAWFALPPAGAETVNLRLYRYRRVDGVFNYTQISDSVIFDSSDSGNSEWSVIHDLTPNLRAAAADFTSADTLAVSLVASGGNTMRALTVRAQFGCNAGGLPVPFESGVGASTEWPPT